MGADPITGAKITPGESEHPLLGRQFRVVDLGRFDLPSTTATDYLHHTPGFRGRILGLFVIVEADGAGAGADTTIQARINTTSVNGGAVQIELADADADAFIQGTQVADDNAFVATDRLCIRYTVADAFTAGVVRVLLLVEPFRS